MSESRRVELSETEFLRLLEKLMERVQPLMATQVRAEVSTQMLLVNARLHSIEMQAEHNGKNTEKAQVQLAGLAAMFTTAFGTDGLTGVMGIIINGAHQQAKRANELSHDIRGMMQTLLDEKHLRDGMTAEFAKVDEKREKRREKWVGVMKWLAGLGFTTGVWKWFSQHFHLGGK